MVARDAHNVTGLSSNLGGSTKLTKGHNVSGGELLFLIIVILFFIGMINGVIKCFIRQPVVAVLLLLFFLPGLLFWAFIEIFTDDVK